MKLLRALSLSPLLLLGSSLSELQAQDSLRDALTGGTPSLDLRYRFETVDSDVPTQIHTALASTLRTTFGYRTGSFHGAQAFFQFEDTASTWDDLYNDGAGNGKADYPVVVDPTGSSINQAYIDYTINAEHSARLGRQEMVWDNARFIGNVGWRQNHMSYDAVLLEGSPSEEIELKYAYLHGLNRITGADVDAAAHLFNGRLDLGSAGALTGYYYNLDLEGLPLLSSATLGVRYSGKHAHDDQVQIKYAFEYAKQKDAGDNPNGVSADYYNVVLEPMVHDIGFELGLEHLGGSGAGGNRFTTPLATGHKFNGFADQFLVVPLSGLDDLSFGLGGKLAGVNMRLTYHMYQSDAGSIDYGTELDVTLTKKLNEHALMGLKLAAFEADDVAGGFSDITKIMFWTTYSIL